VFRNGFLACGLLILAVAPLLGLDRVDPVVSEEPIPKEAIKAFKDLFGVRVEQALATKNTDDDGKLAEAIFLEAKSRSDSAGFVAHALDHVVRLASVSPRHQSLAYAALRTQARSRIRPLTLCLERMMTLGPGVVGELDKHSRSFWLESVWMQDALLLAELRADQMAFKEAVKCLQVVKDAAVKHRVTFPASLDDNIRSLELLGRLKTDADQVASDKGRKEVLLAILALVTDKNLAKAQQHLEAAGSTEATGLAQAVAAYRQSPNDAAAAAAVTAAASKLHVPRVVRYIFSRSLAEATSGTFKRVINQAFFGVSLAGAKKIVFVVDCSSSMTDKLALTKRELKRSIRTLTPGQMFQVVFFNTQAYVTPGGGLMKGTAANKQKAYQFIDSVGASNGTNPSQALRIAFALDADTINLLTDGEFEPVISDLIDQLNANKRTTVNTICFMSIMGKGLLEKIALRNNGTYKAIDSNSAGGTP